MKLRVRPSTIEGEVSSSPSKSYTHRAMVLALLAEGTSHLRRPLLSGDTLATLSAVRKFGAEADQRRGSAAHQRRQVTLPGRCDKCGQLRDHHQDNGRHRLPPSLHHRPHR